jgi:hypothetical protein
MAAARLGRLLVAPQDIDVIMLACCKWKVSHNWSTVITYSQKDLKLNDLLTNFLALINCWGLFWLDTIKTPRYNPDFKQISEIFFFSEIFFKPELNIGVFIHIKKIGANN